MTPILVSKVMMIEYQASIPGLCVMFVHGTGRGANSGSESSLPGEREEGIFQRVN